MHRVKFKKEITLEGIKTTGGVNSAACSTATPMILNSIPGEGLHFFIDFIHHFTRITSVLCRHHKIIPNGLSI